MNRLMPCMGAHPPKGKEVVAMDDVEVDVTGTRLSTTPASRLSERVRSNGFSRRKTTEVVTTNKNRSLLRQAARRKVSSQ